jgi:hypothetical protein
MTNCEMDARINKYFEVLFENFLNSTSSSAAYYQVDCQLKLYGAGIMDTYMIFGILVLI